MTMLQTWEEGKAEARADTVLTVLEARGAVVSNAARERMAEKDLEQLQRWLVKAAVASSIEDVISDAS